MVSSLLISRCILFILIGGILYYFGYQFHDKDYLKDIGKLMAEGAVAAILFEWLARHEANVSTENIVNEALHRIISPVIQRATSESLSEYRWYVKIEQPASNDILKDYLVQLVHLSYIWPEVPSAIK